MNEDNGFAVIFEAKVLSDISCQIAFDVMRNQIVRNIDVMLESNASLQRPLKVRKPECTLFVLLTPKIFRDKPNTRLYGWLMNDYRGCPENLKRDLPHRTAEELAPIPNRLGWMTWEMCEQVLPGSCPWLRD